MVSRLLPTSSNLSPPGSCSSVTSRVVVRRRSRCSGRRSTSGERAGTMGKLMDLRHRLGSGAPGHLHHGALGLEGVTRVGLPSNRRRSTVWCQAPSILYPPGLSATLPDVRRVLPARSRVSKYQGTFAPMFWMALEPSSADTRQPPSMASKLLSCPGRPRCRPPPAAHRRWGCRVAVRCRRQGRRPWPVIRRECRPSVPEVPSCRVAGAAVRDVGAEGDVHAALHHQRDVGGRSSPGSASRCPR